MKDSLTRRGFIRTAAAGSAALTWLGAGRAPDVFAAEAAKPALLGGTPVHKGGWARWPQWREAWEPELLEVFRSGRWFRGSDERVAEFEQRLRATARRQEMPRHRQRHHGADRQPARDGRGRRRRGHRFALHLHRQLQRHPLAQGAAGVRRHRPGHAHDRSGLHREPHHRPHARHHAGAHFRHAVRHGSRSMPSPKNTSSPSSRMPARRGWRNTKAASAARSATWAASVFRNRSTFRPAKAAPSPA